MCSKCSSPSLGCLRALEPGRRDKTGRPKSYIFSPDFGFRTGFVSPGDHQKWRTARWNSGLGLRAVEPGLRPKTECPKSYIFSPDFGHPAQVPTCSPVVSCLQSTLTTWLYIVTWLLLDRLSHLIGGGSKTCFGPKSG